MNVVFETNSKTLTDMVYRLALIRYIAFFLNMYRNVSYLISEGFSDVSTNTDIFSYVTIDLILKRMNE